MANLSLHCFLASLGLAIVAYFQNRRLGGPALLLAACWCIAVFTAVPPPDAAFPAGKNIAESWKKVVSTAEHRPYALQAPIAGPSELAQIPPPVHHRTSTQNAMRKLGRVLALLTFPLSTIRWLGLAVALLVLIHGFCLRTGSSVGSIGLAPYLLLLLPFLSLYLAPRHTGVLFVTFLVAAWLTWPDEGLGKRPIMWTRALTAALLLITVEQIAWTGRALYADVHGSYSGGEAAALFLRDQAAGKRVAGFYYHSVALLPYLEGLGRNLYVNQHPQGFWDWSRANRVDPQAPPGLAVPPGLRRCRRVRMGRQCRSYDGLERLR